jgi:hypothetical protein
MILDLSPLSTMEATDSADRAPRSESALLMTLRSSGTPRSDPLGEQEQPDKAAAADWNSVRGPEAAANELPTDSAMHLWCLLI